MAEDLYAGAAEIAASDLDRHDAVSQMLRLAAGDRAALEQTRDRYSRHLHGRPDDFSATAALTLLNRALADDPPVEPLDWKQRWVRGRKP